MPRNRNVQGDADKGASREAILEAAVRAVRGAPASSLTVDAVAREAGCAKGLVHYHFKTKVALFAAAATRIWEVRTKDWTRALASGTPERAIQASWTLLTDESKSGASKACASLAALGQEVTDRAVRMAMSAYSQQLADSVTGLLGHVGLEPSVPAEELGRLTAAVVLGAGTQLDQGAQAAEVEGAYLAFWAGMLSLTQAAGTNG